MQAVLADIRSGAFAQRFIDDQDAGAPGVHGAAREGCPAPDRGHRPRAAQADGLGRLRPRPGLRRGLRRALTRDPSLVESREHAVAGFAWPRRVLYSRPGCTPARTNEASAGGRPTIHAWRRSSTTGRCGWSSRCSGPGRSPGAPPPTGSGRGVRAGGSRSRWARHLDGGVVEARRGLGAAVRGPGRDARLPHRRRADRDQRLGRHAPDAAAPVPARRRPRRRAVVARSTPPSGSPSSTPGSATCPGGGPWWPSGSSWRSCVVSRRLERPEPTPSSPSAPSTPSDPPLGLSAVVTSWAPASTCWHPPRMEARPSGVPEALRQRMVRGPPTRAPASGRPADDRPQQHRSRDLS